MNNFIRQIVMKLSYPGSIRLLPKERYVISGPFRGLRYLDPTRRTGFFSKLLGTYELELHEVIRAIIATHFDCIIDIGGAEGYYAVGLACMHPNKPSVIAYEADLGERELLNQLKQLNRAENLTIHGKCEIADMANFRGVDKKNLIICDTEGYECELLNSAEIPFMRSAWILVEIHDFIRRGTKELITERFSETHRISVISAKERTIGDLPPATSWARLVPDRFFVRAMQEHRPNGMQWLWMEPILQ